jgi:small subunit ribosomal protein S6
LKAYEAVFILDERRFEDGGEAFAERFCELVGQLGGAVKQRNPMGRRQFARPIRKLRAGIYWDFILDMPAENVAELKERYRLDENVLRLVVMIYEGPARKASVAEE